MLFEAIKAWDDCSGVALFQNKKKFVWKVLVIKAPKGGHDFVTNFVLLREMLAMR